MEEMLENGVMEWHDDGLFVQHAVALPYADGIFQMRITRNSPDTVVLMLSSQDMMLLTIMLSNVASNTTADEWLHALRVALRVFYFQPEAAGPGMSDH